MTLRRGKGGDIYHLECYRKEFKKEPNENMTITNNNSHLTATVICPHCKKEIKEGEVYTWT